VADEIDPVSPDEFVLRKVPDRPSYYDPSLPQPVSRLAFAPTERDTDGISLFRSVFTTPEMVSALSKPKGCWITQLIAQAFFDFDLTIKPDPLRPGWPRGHSLVPELNWAARQQKEDKALRHRLKEIQVELAKLAGHGVIYHSEPDE